MIKIYIPGLPCKSYEYRRGDAQVIHDDEKHAIVIDGGEPDLCNKIVAYCRNVGISHVTYILTHWHLDHDAGMKQLLDSSLIVDKIYCPPPSELRGLQESGANEDYSRALRRIAQAEKLGKPIVYPTAGVDTTIVVGKIRCRIWRRKATASDKNDYEINNTSLVTYFPDLYYLTTGDTINSFDIYLSSHPDTVKVFKIPHHGNACTDTPCSKLIDRDAKLCWYNDWEKRGSSVGSSSFSKWGAGYTKKYFTTLRTDADIYMSAFNKTLHVQYGHNHYSFTVPYDGKAPVDRWVKGSKGWWYEYKDGTYAVGWKKLPWSKGENWFFFNSSGWMCTGWIFDGGCWYYCDPKTGAMQTGWMEWKGRKCYLEPVSGCNQGHAYQDCVASIGGKTYSFDSDCYATEITSGSVTGKLNEISAARRQFVLEIAQLVRKYAPQYGVKVYSPIIAQAIHESGWGESSLGYKYHNYFGLKCGTLWKGKSVNLSTKEEYSAGTLTTISANFRVYDSMEEGVRGYFVFLFEGRTRFNNLKGVTDPRTYLQRIKDDGYATGKNYADNCMNLVNLYSLTQFDGSQEAKGKYPRADIVSLAQSFVGTAEGGTIHHRIIDQYNAHRPLPRGYKMTYKDAWCATFCSYLAIACGYTAIIPVECGCPQWIMLAKGLGSWVESDTYTPRPGDFVLYDWQDSGSGDNTGTPDHIGIVEKVEDKTVTVIEGNYNDSVKRRQITIGGRYIRGYVTPKYSD